MKVRAGVAVAMLLCLAVFFFWQDDRFDPRGSDEKERGAVVNDGDSAAELVEIKMMPVAEESLRLNSVDLSPEGDIAILEMLLAHYRRVYETNPVGLNHEITKALAGGNSKRAAFLSPEHPAISESGELLDRWGTPFFFHQISGTKMEVVSAGPDGELRTADDVKSE